MSDEFNAGFVRDEQGRLVLSDGSDSEGWISGFVRDAEGRLVVTGPEGSEISGAITPKRYGAKGDGTQLTDGAMTKGSAVLSSEHIFKHADVGKEITVERAGPGSGLPLVTTIASVAAGKATLARAAESTVSGKRALFATDDTKAIQKAIDAANVAYLLTGAMQTVEVSSGRYLLSYANGSTNGAAEVALVMKSGVSLCGDAFFFTMPPVATIVTKAIVGPFAAATLEVASTDGFSITNKNIRGSVKEAPGTGNVGITWSAKTATTFTATTANALTMAVGTVISQQRNRHMIATLSGSVVENWKLRGITFDGETSTDDAEAPGGFAEEDQHGILVLGARKFEIDHVCVKRAAGKAFYIQGDGATLAEFSIHDCEAFACYGNAIRVSPPATHWSLKDNYFHDVARPIGGAEGFITTTSLGCEDGKVEGNIWENWGCVDISGTRMSWCNNYIRAQPQGGMPGIRIMTCAESAINDNVIDMSPVVAETPTSAPAIINESNVTDTSITGNLFIGATLAGTGIIDLKFTCERVNFSGNTCQGRAENSGAGIGSAAFKEVTVSGNFFHLLGGTSQVRVRAPGGSVGSNVVTGGRILIEGDKTAVTGNSVSVLAGATNVEAIRMLAAGCTVTGNIFKGANGTVGVVRLSNACKDGVICNNVIEATAVNADWIVEESECDRNLIEGNHVIAASTGSDIVVVGPNTVCRRNHGSNGTDYLSRKTVAADYTIKRADQFVAVTSTAAERTLTLPEASKAPMGIPYTVKDESGGAAAKNIKLVPKTPGTEKIDEAEVLTISANYGKAVVYSNQVNWFTV